MSGNSTPKKGAHGDHGDLLCMQLASCLGAGLSDMHDNQKSDYDNDESAH